MGGDDWQLTVTCTSHIQCIWISPTHSPLFLQKVLIHPPLLSFNTSNSSPFPHEFIHTLPYPSPNIFLFISFSTLHNPSARKNGVEFDWRSALSLHSDLSGGVSVRCFVDFGVFMAEYWRFLFGPSGFLLPTLDDDGSKTVGGGGDGIQWCLIFEGWMRVFGCLGVYLLRSSLGC